MATTRAILSILSILFCIHVNEATVPATTTVTDNGLVHIPLTSKPVPASRLYSFSQRTWYTHYEPLIPSNISVINEQPEQVVKSDGISSSPIHGSITPVGEYFAVLSFDGQPVHVQLDTGSSTMAVPLAKCDNCRLNDRRLKLSGKNQIVPCQSATCAPNKCVPSKSGMPFGTSRSISCGACSSKFQCCSLNLPSGCSFQLKYADNSGVTGTLVKTTVQIGDLTSELTVGGILSQSKFEAKYVDGIFGLAFKTLACNPTCVLPLVDKLYETKKIPKNVFSMCLNSQKGVLTLGGSNPKLYYDQLSYVPFSKSFDYLFYKVDIKSWSIGGNQVNLPMISNGIVDSGTTLLVVSDKTYLAMKSYFQANYCNVPGLCSSHMLSNTQKTRPVSIIKHPSYYSNGINSNQNYSNLFHSGAKEQTWFAPGYCVALSQGDLALLPSMTIHLYGYDLEISPDTYMIPHAIGNKIYQCLGISSLAGMEYMPNDVILGDTILQKYFVEYDRDNQRIGFAVARDCDDKTAVESAPDDAKNVPTTPPSSSSSSSDSSGSNWFTGIFSNVPSIFFYIVVIGLGLLGANKFLRRSGYESIST